MASFSEYRTFCKICELNSITAAAKALHKSTSAVSKQLKKLETGLAVQLIDRSTKTITVTPLGKAFYQQCLKILQSVEYAEQALKDQTVSASGQLVLSFPEVLLRTPLLKLLTQFSEQYPKIHFDIRVSNELDNVIDDGIDFAFRIGQLNDSGLTALNLFAARIKCVASPGYIRQHGAPTTLADAFENHRMLAPSFVNLTENLKRLLGYSDNVSLQQSHLMNNEIAIFDAVVLGMGVAALLDVSVKSELENGNLVDLFPDQLLPPQQVFLLYHKRDYMPEKMRLFREFIKQQYRFSPASGFS